MREEARSRRFDLTLSTAILLLVLHALAYLPWTEDDAGISLRYAVHLASGQGLVYNPGERVEAISNLGYVLLLAPFQALLFRGDPGAELLLAAKLLGLVAAIGALREASRLARALALEGPWRALALCLPAASAPFAAWPVGGLEVPFVLWGSAALIAAAAELAAGREAGSRGAARRAALAAAGLALVRVDGFVLPFALGLALAVLVPRARRAALTMVLAALAVLLLVTLFRLGYYGEAWPNPVHAKVDLRTSAAALQRTVSTYLLPFLSLHGGAALVAMALATAPARGRQGSVTAAAVLALVAYALLVGGDWMPLHRFLAPAVIPLAALLACLAEAVARAARVRPGKLLAAAAVLAVVAGAGLAGRAAFKTRRAAPLWYFQPTLRPKALVASWSPAVEWLVRHTEPDALLLTSEAGFIPCLSGRPTVDSYGLATPALARLPRGSVERSSLGIHAVFREGEPAGPAEAYLASVPARAVVLQERMVRGWNQGRVPPSLYAGRFRLVTPQPLGGRWLVYEPAEPRP